MTSGNSLRRCGVPLAILALALVGGTAAAFPLDDADGTDIGRLEAQRRIEAGTMAGDKQPPGALLPSAMVDLRLRDLGDFSIPPADSGFSSDLSAVLGAAGNRYSVALLDLSDLARPVYAEHRATEMYNPGSVGKLLVALGWLQLLADRYPTDTQARTRLLRETTIIADDVIVSDSHTVRRWDREAGKLIRRPLAVGDPGSVIEYLDWMVSASSNAAASVLIRQGMLLKRHGDAYPLDTRAAEAYFRQAPRAERESLLSDFLQSPVTRNGFDLNELRQGSPFTRRGKALVSGTSSHANARALMKFLVAMERGQLVDEYSSRLLKRLMYQTERRIRYATSPALTSAAVYFKSGSLFECRPEPGFVCKAYAGNIKNLMHSVAIVEAPAAERRLYYIVVVMSNVLRKNSAVDHQSLGTRIHRLIERRHPVTGTPMPESASVAQ